MRFCKLHLPKHDTSVFLETENGEEYVINYISERTALSGGWKAFCAAHELHEGDVLVFHLVKPLKFKVPSTAFICSFYFLIANAIWCSKTFRNKMIRKKHSNSFKGHY